MDRGTKPTAKTSQAVSRGDKFNDPLVSDADLTRKRLNLNALILPYSTVEDRTRNSLCLSTEEKKKICAGEISNY